MARPRLAKVTGALATRIGNDGKRNIKLTDEERAEYKKMTVIDQIVCMYLDLSKDWTNREMAEEIGISIEVLKNLTRTEEFVNTYNSHFIDLGHDPRLKATQAAIVDMLSVAQRELKNMLISPTTPPGVKLNVINTVMRMAGMEEPKAQVNDKKELAEFLKNTGINIENVNVSIPQEYKDAVQEDVIEGVVREVPSDVGA